MNPNLLAPPIAGVSTPLCQARVLIAWLSADRLAQYVNAPDHSDAHVKAQLDQGNAARRDRAHRLPPNSIEPIPSELAEHVAQVREIEAFVPFANEGWDFGIADLRDVVAAQPHVFCADHGRRFDDLTSFDLSSLAPRCLPTERHAAVGIMAIGDATGQLKTFKVVSDDITLRADLTPDGTIRFSGQLSFMQVARFQERNILRDGYHRAVELLSRGVNHVPVLYREIANIDELFPPFQRPGMLPESAWLGDDPALLGDYLDPELSRVLDVPKPAKALVVQIAELPWP